ncbi:unnamed protein product [Lymnaea stagnalis]|uniref:Nose resistant-to-fluoxetine protein N-terminal domain-containing protein n=1 Tax=Lymnaea stagnalis TaxID=6523 RepID=A0AAV2HMC1_LYMST
MSSLSTSVPDDLWRAAHSGLKLPSSGSLLICEMLALTWWTLVALWMGKYVTRAASNGLSAHETGQKVSLFLSNLQKLDPEYLLTSLSHGRAFGVEARDRWTSRNNGRLSMLDEARGLTSGFDDVMHMPELPNRSAEYLTDWTTNVSTGCVHDILVLVSGMASKEYWALQLLDSWGKPGPSLLEGRLNLAGNYRQCHGVRWPSSGNGSKGNYCVMRLSVNKWLDHMLNVFAKTSLVQLGSCWPDSCSEFDIGQLLQYVLKILNLTSNFNSAAADCRTDHREITTATIASIVIASIIGGLLLFGTIFDLIFVFRRHQVRDTPHETTITDGGSMGFPNQICRIDDANMDQNGVNHTYQTDQESSDQINEPNLTSSWADHVISGVSRASLLNQAGCHQVSTDNLTTCWTDQESNEETNQTISLIETVDCHQVTKDRDQVTSCADQETLSQDAQTNDLDQTTYSLDQETYSQDKMTKTNPVDVSQPLVETKAAQEEQISHGFLVDLLLTFSVYTNSFKLLKSSQPPGSLTAVNGIRFISMSWIILGHMYSYGVEQFANTLTVFPLLLHRWTSDVIANSFVSVDTFFTISGFLVAYVTFKDVLKNGWRINWALFYVHRYWRLTPPYILTLTFVLGFQRFLGSGPLWETVQPWDKTDCEKNWWTNLLYLNNLINVQHECFGHAWYLANDMQFYLVAPLMIIPFHIHALSGVGSCLMFLLVHWLTTAILSVLNDWPAVMVGLDTHIQEVSPHWLKHYYIVPWCRIGPYIIGILAGYYMAVSNGKMNLRKSLTIVGWLVAIATGVVIVFGLRGDIGGDNPCSLAVAAFYNSMARTAWGVCIAWVIVTCGSGWGGPVNTILSWSPFVPLGRLTYMAYLIHPCLTRVYFGNHDVPYLLNDTNLVISYLGILVFTYLTAFFLSLALESPMIGLEKVILAKLKCDP